MDSWFNKREYLLQNYVWTVMSRATGVCFPFFSFFLTLAKLAGTFVFNSKMRNLHLTQPLVSRVCFPTFLIPIGFVYNVYN